MEHQNFEHTDTGLSSLADPHAGVEAFAAALESTMVDKSGGNSVRRYVSCVCSAVASVAEISCDEDKRESQAHKQTSNEKSSERKKDEPKTD